MAKARNRYDNLFDTLDALMPDPVYKSRDLRYLEVGTYNGVRAMQLISYWKNQTGGDVTYVGFDLFEDMDPATAVAEISKTKPTPPLADVQRKLTESTQAKIHLIKGNTKVTLPEFMTNPLADRVYDLLFIDGGHSLETINNDWVYVSRLISPRTVVMFDDYFVNRDDAGCRKLIDSLAGSDLYDIRLLDPMDSFAHTGLQIRMVRLTHKDRKETCPASPIL